VLENIDMAGLHDLCTQSMRYALLLFVKGSLDQGIGRVEEANIVKVVPVSTLTIDAVSLHPRLSSILALPGVEHLGYVVDHS
jgi:hypothetical protein